MPSDRAIALTAMEDTTMDLLNRLNKQAVELWQKHVDCKNRREKELLLNQYKVVFAQYAKHKEWLKAMDH